jgi:hypothetical protein
MYDRPKRGEITILFRVLVKRQAARMHFPAEETADLGFFDRLPTNATPTAKFFWKSGAQGKFRRSAKNEETEIGTTLGCRIGNK